MCTCLVNVSVLHKCIQNITVIIDSKWDPVLMFGYWLFSFLFNGKKMINEAQILSKGCNNSYFLYRLMGSLFRKKKILFVKSSMCLSHKQFKPCIYSEESWHITWRIFYEIIRIAAHNSHMYQQIIKLSLFFFKSYLLHHGLLVTFSLMSSHHIYKFA